MSFTFHGDVGSRLQKIKMIQRLKDTRKKCSGCVLAVMNECQDNKRHLRIYMGGKDYMCRLSWSKEMSVLPLFTTLPSTFRISSFKQYN